MPTDIQAQWTVLMAVANGGSRIEDRVFPGRSLHVAELNRIGANIVCRNGTFVVTGTRNLKALA